MRNVLLITIDALCSARLKDYDIPTLSHLMQNGINCVNTFTHASRTHFAFPSILTSRLPLDGGYTRGIKEDSVSLPEVLKKNGYTTIGYTSIPWLSKFFYYNRGFDEFHQVFGMNCFWKSIKKVWLSHWLQLRKKNIITEEEFQNEVNGLFKDIFKFAKDKESGRKRHFFIKELEYLLKNGYSLNRVDYLYSNLVKFGSVSYDWARLKCRRSLLFYRLKHEVMKILRKYIVKNNHYQTPNATHLRKLIIKRMKSIKEPFFLWAHFFDLHIGNYNTIPFKNPFCKDTYAKSLEYIDRELGKIMRFLKDSGLLDDTLVVVTSDHGWMTHHKYKDMLIFFEEFVKLPLVFYSPSLKPQVITELCGHIDIAPTILEMLKFAAVGDFKGEVVGTKRDYIILEHTYKGIGDLKRDPIYLCVRTRDYKYIWKEFKDDEDISGTPNEMLFNLRLDPLEKENIISSPDLYPAYDNLRNIAQKRYSQIK